MQKILDIYHSLYTLISLYLLQLQLLPTLEFTRMKIVQTEDFGKS